ncbi:hypothetical protein NCTGTJJY_CDS0156 [Serratia phage 92A1]|nr:hypothetical protein NCTGTJJY_CDS0156 [Serratia phage 92A1]
MKIATAIRNVLGFCAVSSGTGVIIGTLVGALSRGESLLASAVVIVLLGLTSVFDQIQK